MLKTLAQLKPGQTVLIHAAAGGVGSLAVQIAKILGASHIVGTASLAEKLEFVKSLGADTLVNYRDADWQEQVMQATDGKGVDVVLEAVGGDVRLSPD